VKIQAVVLTAGLGLRMKADGPKALMTFLGLPLFSHCLRRLEAEPLVESIVLVAGADRLARFERVVRREGFRKVRKVVPGGERRCDSVARGLAALDDDTTHVVVHDGARPYFCPDALSAALKIVRDAPAVIMAVPVKPTIKEVDPETLTVRNTLRRECLWEAQTPQVFRRDVLRKAHEQDKSDNPTDDAVLVERLGLPVKVVLGDYRNIKITTPEDLPLAEELLKDKI
jgi:2-C-methyl-D-erythritol 4-phosphate cytidylyltransferase